MDPYRLLVLSLALVVALDFLFACTYLLLVRLETDTPQFWREDIRRSFSPILMVLCLFQIVFLSIGFSIIADDIYKVYQSVTDPDSRTSLSRQWHTFCIVIGPLTTVGVVILCLAITRLKATLNHFIRIPLAQINYFWISHGFLSLSAVFAIIISCHELPYEEDPTKAVLVSLLWSAFTIVTFELGLGLWIYAALYWLKIEAPARMSFD